MKVPTSYSDLTVSQYMKVYEIKHDDFDSEIDRMASWISYFTGKEFNDVMEMDIDKFKELSVKLSFLKFDLPLYHIVDNISIDKQLFKGIKTLTEMKVNQMIDYSSILKENKNDISKCLDKLLPIIYVQNEYDPNKHEENVKLLSKAKVSEVSGLVFFYSDYWSNAEMTIQAYTENSISLITERMKWIAENPRLVPS